MKKIITLLFCIALLSSAFAQNNHRDEWKNDINNRDDPKYDNNRDDGKYNSDRDDRKNVNNSTVYQNNRYGIAQRDQLIQRINREYDYKIQQVSYDRYMNRREKKRAIKTLEAQKAEQINQAYSEYKNRYVYSDNRNHDYKQNGRNNGNDHYNR